MFKDIQSGFTKFFTRDKIIIFIALLILGYSLFVYSDSKSRIFDNLENGTTGAISHSTEPENASLNQPYVNPNSKNNSNVASPTDLLPMDENSQWAALNPVSIKEGYTTTPALMTAGEHQGIDTVGQTMKNANLQLRSDPIIPKIDVGPWQNSTIEADYARTPLELGYGPR